MSNNTLFESDVEFLEFSKGSKSNGGGLNDRFVSVGRNDGRIFFSRAVREEIKDFSRVKIGRNKYSGDTFFVFTNEEDGVGFNLQKSKGVRNGFSCKDCAKFLLDTFASKDAVFASFGLSENRCLTTDFKTFKIEKVTNIHKKDESKNQETEE